MKFLITGIHAIKCKDPNCVAKFGYLSQLRFHLQDKHVLDFSTEKKEFQAMKGTLYHS